MKITREWGIKAGGILLAAAWLSLVAVSWADASETAPTDGAPVNEAAANRSPAAQGANSNGDGEYNFNWLDPEKKIYVLQNRRYLKGGKPMLSVMGGMGFSNPYRSTWNLEGRAAYYFNEQFGIELFYKYTHNASNSAFQALQGTGVGVLPVFREITGQFGGLAHWVPWYAKINVFNKIIYFDWYLAGGAGDLRANVFNSPGTGTTGVSQDMFAFYLGTGHVYHLTERFIARADFTGAIYRAQIFGTSGASAWYSNLDFALGVGMRL